MDNFEEELTKIITADSLCGVVPVREIKYKENDMYHVKFKYNLNKIGEQDDCQICIQAPKNPIFTWSPHLTPEEGYIVQQHVFRTPALIFKYENQTWILIPDHKTLEKQSVPSYLDINSEEGKMMLGLSNSKVVDHVLYKKKRGTVWGKGNTEIAFYIMLTKKPLENPFRFILSFYWENFGRKEDIFFKEKNLDLLPYVKHTYDWAFEYWKDVVWQEFMINGQQVGAPVFIVTTTQSPNYHGVKKEREVCSIWNQAWFCSLRSASGLYRYARMIGSDKYREYARKTKELALSFPQNNGLFDSVIATEMLEFEYEGKTYMRSMGWDTKYWGNSDRNPFAEDIRHAPKHILDMSFTAEYMLQWYEELEKDERLLDYAGNYAERLLKLQFENGFFPGWVDEKGKSKGILDKSPESSMSAVFFIHYGRMMDDSRFIEAAKKAIDAVCEEIVPNGRWEDFETYWSCSSFWNDHVGEKIRRNNMYKQCNLSMFFTAWALLELYELQKEKKYLIIGQRVLDEMLMTQSSYQPKNMPIPTLGGFGVLNADAELNDARQSLFAELILRYGEILGLKEYEERGAAALKRSFTMMYCPENPEVKIQWEKVWPFLNERDYGFSMENYGHNGYTDFDGMGIGEFTIYDWGNGAAAEAYMRILDHSTKNSIINAYKE